MYLFSNGFRISTKDNLREVAVEFIQSSPNYDEDSKMVGSKTEVVASITMHGDTAVRLKEALDRIIKDNVDEEATEIVE